MEQKFLSFCTFLFKLLFYKNRVNDKLAISKKNSCNNSYPKYRADDET